MQLIMKNELWHARLGEGMWTAAPMRGLGRECGRQCHCEAGIMLVLSHEGLHIGREIECQG